MYLFMIANTTCVVRVSSACFISKGHIEKIKNEKWNPNDPLSILSPWLDLIIICYLMMMIRSGEQGESSARREHHPQTTGSWRYQVHTSSPSSSRTSLYFCSFPHRAGRFRQLLRQCNKFRNIKWNLGFLSSIPNSQRILLLFFCTILMSIK